MFWIINGRGCQMKAKSVHRLLQNHAMPGYSTGHGPTDDNPFIESAFSTLKRFPEYPGQFLDLEEAQVYFTKYFQWYNEIIINRV